jgi:3',5'-cyclic AMP phosphodiesterase CpdA
MTPKLRLAIIGDPHLGVPQGDDDTRLDCDPGFKLHPQSAQLLAAAVAAANAEPELDAVLILGDMTRDSELFNNEAAAALLAELKSPLYILAGNHDYVKPRREGVSYPDCSRLDRAEFVDFWHKRGLPEPAEDYTAELPGNVTLVALDTNATMDELAALGWPDEQIDYGYVSPGQLQWLDTRLAAIRAQGRLPLVTMHHTILPQTPAEREGHPMAGIFGFWQVKDGDELRRILLKHEVPLVVSGHLHIQSVNSIEPEGAGSRARPETGGAQGRPPSSRSLTNLACASLVSYPHTWGMLTVGDGAIVYESRSLAPFLPAGFIESSRAGTIEGIELLIAHGLKDHPLLASHRAGIAMMIAKSDWWPRLCDGTLAGFSVDKSLLPNNPLTRLVYAKVAEMLNEYGTWKAERGDPNRVKTIL